jgi:hypothetical protein
MIHSVRSLTVRYNIAEPRTHHLNVECSSYVVMQFVVFKSSVQSMNGASQCLAIDTSSFLVFQSV